MLNNEDDIIEFIVGTATTLADLNAFIEMDDIADYIGFVEKIIDNLSTVTTANALKLTSYFAIKDEPDKLDLRLFFKTFISRCSDIMILDGKHTMVSVIARTSNALDELSIRGINKAMLFDDWIMCMMELLDEDN